MTLSGFTSTVAGNEICKESSIQCGSGGGSGYLGSDVDEDSINEGYPGSDKMEATLWAEKYAGSCKDVGNTYEHTVHIGSHFKTFNDYDGVVELDRLANADITVSASGDATALTAPEQDEWHGGWANEETEPSNADIPDWGVAVIDAAWTIATASLSNPQSIALAMALGYLGSASGGQYEADRTWIFGSSSSNTSDAHVWMRFTVTSQMGDESTVSVSAMPEATTPAGYVKASTDFTLTAPSVCPDEMAINSNGNTGDAFITVKESDFSIPAKKKLLTPNLRKRLNKRGQLTIERATTLGRILEQRN